MKRILIWSSLVVVLLASAAWSQAGGTEKAVADLEQEWLKSQQTNNPDLIASSLAEKIVDTEADGKVYDRAKLLEIAKKTKYESADYTDLKVTVFGSTAIATERRALDLVKSRVLLETKSDQTLPCFPRLRALASRIR